MNYRIRNFLLSILAIPKTIYFNFKYLKFNEAIKLPIKISHRVWLASTNGRINIKSENIKTGMIEIGFGEVGIFDQNRSRSVLNISGDVVFKGKCRLGHGSKISVGKNGTLEFGNNLIITAESSIACEKHISFGENCVLSWDILIMDSDFHKIKDCDSEIINRDREIIIGNNVWIGCRATILKGNSIGNNCVIAAGTLITKNFEGENLLIGGGNTPQILKENITWEG